MGEHRQPGAWRMKADALRLMGKEREANSAYERARYVLAKRIRELEGLTLPKPEDDEEITVTGADGDEEKEPADCNKSRTSPRGLQPRSESGCFSRLS